METVNLSSSMEVEEAKHDDRKLFEASLAGDAQTLVALLREDPLLLDRLSLSSSRETPLHVAALRGHVDFARSLLRSCPRLVSEPDSLGRTPLHVAAASGQVGVVREILRSPQGGSVAAMCQVKNKEGLIPIHAAVEKGRVEVVRELARACPESTRVRLGRGETLLHLCVRCDCLEAMKVILGEMDMDGADGGSSSSSSLLEERDDDGNTVLHLAALYKQLETVKYLHSRPTIDPNTTRNKNGFTPLDLVVHNSPRDLKSLELLAYLLGIDQAKGSHSQFNYSTSLPVSPAPTTWPRTIFNHHTSTLEDLRGPLIIVSSVLASITFLLGVKPPEDGSDLSTLWGFNTLSFVLSLVVLLLLVSGWPLKGSPFWSWILVAVFCASMVFMAIAYLEAVFFMPERLVKDDSALALIVVFLVVVGLVGLVHTLGLVKWIKVKVFK